MSDARPVHLRPRAVLLVAVGGTIGTAAREAISLAVPAIDGLPVAIFGINVAGALFLGALLEALARRGPDAGGRQAVRLFAGTGFAGGFTTYSALAVDGAALIGDGRVAAGIGYLVATVLLGGLATWCGILIGAAVARRGTGESER